jgi:hypothetical protein
LGDIQDFKPKKTILRLAIITVLGFLIMETESIYTASIQAETVTSGKLSNTVSSWTSQGVYENLYWLYSLYGLCEENLEHCLKCLKCLKESCK